MVRTGWNYSRQCGFKDALSAKMYAWREQMDAQKERSRFVHTIQNRQQLVGTCHKLYIFA